MNILNFILILAAIIAIAAVIGMAIYHSHKETINCPQYKCNHSMTTILTRDGHYTKEYLSTCSKCGKQTHHFFSGLN